MFPKFRKSPHNPPLAVIGPHTAPRGCHKLPKVPGLWGPMGTMGAYRGLWGPLGTHGVLWEPLVAYGTYGVHGRLRSCMGAYVRPP